MHVSRFGYRDAETIALDGDLASRDRMSGGEDPQLIGFFGIERNHRTAAHAQELLHRHRAAAEHDAQFDIDMMDLAFAGHATTPFDSALVEPERVAGA
jgi:hypothetical protein